MTDEELRELLTGHVRELERRAGPVPPLRPRRPARWSVGLTTAVTASAAVLLALALAWPGRGRVTPGSGPSTGPEPTISFPGVTPPVPAGPAAPRCAARSLRVSPVRAAADSMPGLVVAVRFRNAGSRACSVTGFPAVSARPGANALRVRYTAQNAAWTVARRPVLLRPGASAAVDVLISSFSAVTFVPCRTPQSMAVAPPGGGPATWIVAPPSWQGVCVRGQVEVSPVYPARYAPLIGQYPRR
jgi:hypothetical protein